MVEIKNLVKQYGNFRLDISMKLESGTVTGLVGRNGAGKSTTIKAILGLVSPDSGSVKVFGKDSASLTPSDKAKIGAAMSDSGFSSYLSINDIIFILKNMYPDFSEDDFRSLCSKYSLPTDKRIKDFSTGMNARLRVLVALSHGAKLLVLDEPTAGLDVIARGEVLDMLRGYLAEDPERAILISSHISSDLEGLCDDICMIHDGKVILHEDTDVILGQYALLKVSEGKYAELDKQYLLKTQKTGFGYACLTDQRQFYAENYPDIVIENGGIDDLIVMMSEGGNK